MSERLVNIFVRLLGVLYKIETHSVSPAVTITCNSISSCTGVTIQWKSSLVHVKLVGVK
jgi:hypothetical protein